MTLRRWQNSEKVKANVSELFLINYNQIERQMMKNKSTRIRELSMKIFNFELHTCRKRSCSCMLKYWWTSEVREFHYSSWENAAAGRLISYDMSISSSFFSSFFSFFYASLRSTDSVGVWSSSVFFLSVTVAHLQPMITSSSFRWFPFFFSLVSYLRQIINDRLLNYWTNTEYTAVNNYANLNDWFRQDVIKLFQFFP